MATSVNPYVGPRVFVHGERLYARDNELRQIQEQLLADRVVVLHSPSGAGKSSLINAGLLPLMREAGFYILPTALVNILPPNMVDVNRYAFSVITCLEEGLQHEERRPLDSPSVLTMDECLKQYPRPADAPPSDLVVIDQFEEVLSLDPTDLAAKEEFFRQLGVALRNRDRYALFAMREDYLGALAPYRRFIPGHLFSTFRLDLLGREAALEAVCLPAQSCGVDFDEEAAHFLVDDLCRMQVQRPDGTIVSVLGPHVEPVQLQVVLYRIWENLPQGATAIHLEDVESKGDVSQSLGEYYDSKVYESAHEVHVSEYDIREWFGTRLITAAGMRNLVLMGAGSSDGLDNQVIGYLENFHLVRSEKRGGTTWFELAHDRLVEPILRSNRKWFAVNPSLR